MRIEKLQGRVRCHREKSRESQDKHIFYLRVHRGCKVAMSRMWAVENC